jgi:tRNA(adenine34) deaminase
MSHLAFEERVAKAVAQLQSMKPRALEAASASARLSWLEENAHRLDLPDPVTPRFVYKTLFFDKMGLRPEDLPVLSETPSEIVWSSRNPCPTLEACLRLELDTRQVCRAVNEKPTQAFVSWFDPHLRFLRDYEWLRPRFDGCCERILRVDFEGLMRPAIEEALLSRESGNKGYGAVVALGNRILATAHDTAATEGDPSLHAEVNAIRLAIRSSGDANLSGAILFSTCEPCPMCSSLAVWANLSAIVFGVSIEETSRLGKARIRVSASEIAEQAPTLIEVLGHVLHDECLELYD